MPGVGIAAPQFASLGENSRMLIGGQPGLDLTVQVLNGLIIRGPNQALVRIITGTADIGGVETDVADNMSGGFSESSRGPRNCSIVADCIWRVADNPIGLPPNFQELDLTPRIMIWPDMLNDPASAIKLPVGFCQGFTITVAGTADIRFSLRLKNQGRYYQPGRIDPMGLWA